MLELALFLRSCLPPNEFSPLSAMVDNPLIKQGPEQGHKAISVLPLKPSPFLLFGLKVIPLEVLNVLFEGLQQIHLRLVIQDLVAFFLYLWPLL